MRGFVLLGLTCTTAVLLAGCGGEPSTAEVSGTVTFDGQPLAEGQISFVPVAGGGKGGGGAITGGSYRVKTQPGKNKVQITASKMMPLPPGEVGMDGAKEEVRQYIPEKYNAKSELTAEVPPSGPVNFDLKSK